MQLRELFANAAAAGAFVFKGGVMIREPIVLAAPRVKEQTHRCAGHPLHTNSAPRALRHLGVVGGCFAQRPYRGFNCRAAGGYSFERGRAIADLELSRRKRPAFPRCGRHGHGRQDERSCRWHSEAQQERRGPKRRQQPHAVFVQTAHDREKKKSRSADLVDGGWEGILILGLQAQQQLRSFAHGSSSSCTR